MKKYDFDRVIPRRGTGSLKYDFALARAGREDLLPLWVADMDFALPQEILQKIHERTDHGIFGYTEPDEAYGDTLKSWFYRHYGWEIDPKWNTVVPGVVFAIAVAVQAYTKPGEAVLIQEPVYYPFRGTIESNQRICVNNELREINGHYEIDFDDFERRIRENDVKLFLLCNPHNPVGRVWKKKELERIAAICDRYGVTVVSDEIHCDFIYRGYEFTSYASLGEASLKNTVICTSPSKTFNIAGLQVANILIPNRKLRSAFRRQVDANGYSQVNALGLTAAKAVYDLGEEWLSELLVYLQENLEFFREYLKKNLPDLRLIEPEGTYLLWVDFSKAVNNEQDLVKLIRDRAHLWLDEGSVFSKEAPLYERFNIACPRSIVEQALEQLKEAVYGV